MNRAEPMTPAVRRIITQLVVHRIAAGMSQREVAEHIGLSTNHTSLLERHGKLPLANTLDKWAGVFDRQLVLAADAVFEFDSQEDAGAELRRIRHDLRLTLTDVAAVTGIDPTNLSAIETGRRRAEIVTLLRFGGALGCRMAFVGGRR